MEFQIFIILIFFLKVWKNLFFTIVMINLSKSFILGKLVPYQEEGKNLIKEKLSFSN